MNILRIISLIFIFFTSSCGQLPTIENIELDRWKEDQNGCMSYRLESVDQLMSQKEKLKGLSQNEMISLLGTADKHQLYERSQKFFIYYLEPNENCDQYSEGYVKALFIRFNSLDQAVDFNVQEVK